ncbi:MAG: hypothetical protein M3Y27_06300 [Acidobacteriota bacterium]|nr:hypothetical protein [Acidobacteriota bacterium]
MALDFVLQNRSHRFLPTEREKTSYFCEELKLPETHLPVLNRSNIPLDPLVTRTIAYFHDRDAYEKKDFKRFTQQKLIQFP